jgi:alpha-tubulin suppressor-like RCC1 family protein
MKNLLALGFLALTLTMNAQKFEKVTFGGGHTTALKPDGTLWGWGYAASGQLSTISETEPKPVRLSDDKDWKAVSNGLKNTFAIKKDGTLWACGSNEYGSLGVNSESKTYNYFHQIGEDNNWKKVAPSYLFTVALKEDGTIWAWGQNDASQLGNRSKNEYELAPIQVGEASNWIDVATTSNKTAFAIKEDGTIWGWGLNASSIIVADKCIKTVYLPTQISDDKDWIRIEAGNNHVIAQKKDGTLWAWGDGSLGQLGNNGKENETNIPYQVSNDKFIDFSAGYAVSYGVKEDGTLWAWGRNNFGQLGDGTTETRLVPTQIGMDRNWNQVQARAFQATMIAKEDGTIWYMGWNTFGGFGNGTYANAMTPSKNMNIALLDKKHNNDTYLASADQEDKAEINIAQDNLETVIKENVDVAVLNRK